MKICPLVTQASILEENDKELLVREADDNDLSLEDEKRELNESEDEIFINPESDNSKTGETDTDAEEKSVRFLAKSFRGEVKCLGEICRFHDDEKGECKFEIIFGSVDSENSYGEKIESIKSEMEKSWDFQQKSTSDILSFFKEVEEKSLKTHDAIKKGFYEKMEEIKALISEVNDENKVIIESIADVLAEKTEEIENKLRSNDDGFNEFKNEVSSWKDNLDMNMKTLKTDLSENRKLVEEVTENNSEILKVVENQKQSLNEEEKKRQLADAKRLNNAGVMSYHNGQYEQALELFKKALAIDGEFTEAYNNLGLTYTEMNQEDDATENFKKAIELNPDLSATYNNLGYVFYRMGSYVEAVEMYNEAIGRSKDNSSAWTNLGNAFYKLDQAEEALDAWNKAIEVDPGNEKAKRNLKRFHAEVGESN